MYFIVSFFLFISLMEFFIQPLFHSVYNDCKINRLTDICEWEIYKCSRNCAFIHLLHTHTLTHTQEAKYMHVWRFRPFFCSPCLLLFFSLPLSSLSLEFLSKEFIAHNHDFMPMLSYCGWNDAEFNKHSFVTVKNFYYETE